MTNDKGSKGTKEEDLSKFELTAVTGAAGAERVDRILQAEDVKERIWYDGQPQWPSCKAMMADDRCNFWMVVSGGLDVGFMLNIRTRAGVAQVHSGFLPTWRGGKAVKALRAFCEHLRRTGLRVTGNVQSFNRAAWAYAAAAGFRRTGELKKDFGKRNGAGFDLIEMEWRKR